MVALIVTWPAHRVERYVITSQPYDNNALYPHSTVPHLEHNDSVCYQLSVELTIRARHTFHPTGAQQLDLWSPEVKVACLPDDCEREPKVFEKYMICTRDFCNLPQNGQAEGFQLKVRINYYRGCYLSMIDTLRLVVDGEEYQMSEMTLTVGTRTYTFDQLAKATEARWYFGDPATLTVSKPGGLKPGLHVVQLGLFIRNSYIPRVDKEDLYGFFNPVKDPNGLTHYGEPPKPLSLVATKKMTLVQ